MTPSDQQTDISLAISRNLKKQEVDKPGKLNVKVTKELARTLQYQTKWIGQKCLSLSTILCILSIQCIQLNYRLIRNFERSTVFGSTKSLMVTFLI